MYNKTTFTPNHRYIITTRCSSYVGRHVSFAHGQDVNIADRCTTLRAMLVLLGYVIGLDPEHKRYDRDEYVKINWAAIPEDKSSFK